MRYSPINAELFKLNRRRFTKKMTENAIAIFHSNDLMLRSGDQYYPFRQNADILYLSGIQQEETVIVLFPDCVREEYREIAFIRKTDEVTAIWEGKKLSKEEARAISGIEKVLWIEDMPRILNELILLSKRIYINLNENDRYESEVPSKDLRFARQLMERYPLHKYHRSQPILKKLRMIKSEFEIEQIQKAIDITEVAFRNVLGFLKPGLMEYEVEAKFVYEFMRQGGFPAYNAIIGSGANACALHYNQNNCRCQDGEVLLIDFAAEYANYAADMTRSIPVNGQFTKRQRNVYDAVLRVMREARALLVPGTMIDDYQKEVGKMMESELLGLGLLSKSDIAHQNPEWPAYKKYFMHGTSHHLGLDVHDLGNRYEPIQAGMVFTVEPGIYIPAEKLGIRLENNVLVTDHEPIDLMQNIPIEAEEIEEIMQSVMV